jgi:hypothetical protein
MLDSPTIPVSDLLLEKMQIVELNVKDIKDTIILLLEHDLGSSANREELDVSYLCRILKDDWGFYYTFTQNLHKLQSFIPTFAQIAEKDQATVQSRIEKLLESVENTPKTLRWKLRSKIGTRMRWYNEVTETKEVW